MDTIVDTPGAALAESDDDFDVAALGLRVRTARLAASLNAEGLAKRSGVSRSMIAAIESGAKAPTVNTLHRLATGLGTNMSRLLGDERTGEIVVLRRDEQRIARDPSGWERRDLAPVWPGTSFEFMRTTIPAGVDAGEFPPHAQASREYVAVESGTLRLTIDGLPHDLVAGDAIAYHGNVRHRFANPGVAPCVYYLALEGGIGPHLPPRVEDRR